VALVTNQLVTPWLDEPEQFSPSLEKHRAALVVSHSKEGLNARAGAAVHMLGLHEKPCGLGTEADFGQVRSSVALQEASLRRPRDVAVEGEGQRVLTVGPRQTLHDPGTSPEVVGRGADCGDDLPEHLRPSVAGPHLHGERRVAQLEGEASASIHADAAIR